MKDDKKTDSKKAENKDEPKIRPADEADIDIFKRYGRGPYSEKLKGIEEEVKNFTKSINKLCGIRESDTGLSLPTNWVLEQDKQALQEDSLYVGRLTKIMDPNTDHSRYIVHIKQMAKYVVDLDQNLSSTDVEEGII